MPPQRLIVHHIPVCPFSQRLKILLALKGLYDAVQFHVVDVTRPRDPELLRLSRGSTAMPILQTDQGVLRESLVILRYLDELFAEPVIAQADPFRRAVENMLIAREGPFTTAGYRYVMNQDPAAAASFREALLTRYKWLDEFLTWQNPDGTFLFADFGLAEAVFTPMFVRFWFLEYYEDFELPEGDPQYARVRRWVEACKAHPAAQQVSREEIVKVYYDYAKGAGNGALLPGRKVSSFVFEPDWRARPWPPRDKYEVSATDKELGIA